MTDILFPSQSRICLHFLFQSTCFPKSHLDSLEKRTAGRGVVRARVRDTSLGILAWPFSSVFRSDAEYVRVSPFGACQVLFKCFTCLVTREEPFVEGAAAAAGKTASLMDVFLFFITVFIVISSDGSIIVDIILYEFDISIRCIVIIFIADYSLVVTLKYFYLYYIFVLIFLCLFTINIRIIILSVITHQCHFPAKARRPGDHRHICMCVCSKNVLSLLPN